MTFGEFWSEFIAQEQGTHIIPASLQWLESSIELAAQHSIIHTALSALCFGRLSRKTGNEDIRITSTKLYYSTIQSVNAAFDLQGRVCNDELLAAIMLLSQYEVCIAYS